jgi:hypothetical protein
MIVDTRTDLPHPAVCYLVSESSEFMDADSNLRIP